MSLHALPSFRRALVRQPGESFSNAISRRRQHPDVALAREQHVDYVAALHAAGLDVTQLPPDEHYPDSCFVQDTALVIGASAILLRLSMPSRAGEQESIQAELAPHFRIEHITAPGTVEGGDCMLLPGRLLVGWSSRTNGQGISQLRALLAPLGIPVYGVQVKDFLHLLSGATYLGRDTILAAPSLVDRAEFEGMRVIPVPQEEEAAANVLALGDHVIVPAGFPETARRIAANGFTVLPVPLSEFEKADGGATCLSLLY